MDSSWITVALQAVVAMGTAFFGFCMYIYGRRKGIQAERLATMAFISDLYTWPDRPVPRELRKAGKKRRRKLLDQLTWRQNRT